MKSKIKLSATRINTFLQCKQKYWFNYVDKRPKLKNPAFKLGLAVHQTLEFAGSIWKAKEKFDVADKRKITDKYKQVAISEGIDDPIIYSEGLDLVKKRLKDFVHEAKSILGLEISFGFNNKESLVTPNGVPLIGAMDKVLELDKDTILIVDYKTSKTAPTVDQLRKDIQLSLYDVAASLLWPDKRIIVSLDLLKHDILYSYRTPEERAEFIDYLGFIYDAMKGLEKKDVTTSLNTFCPWCDFRDYCDEYQSACNSTTTTFTKILKLSKGDLVKEWQKIRNMKNIYTQREKELSSILITKIRASGKNITTDDQELYIRQNSRKNYDLSTVSDTIPDKDLVKVVSVNKKALENYMERNPSVKNKITSNMTGGFTNPFLSTRKVR